MHGLNDSRCEKGYLSVNVHQQQCEPSTERASHPFIQVNNAQDVCPMANAAIKNLAVERFTIVCNRKERKYILTKAVSLECSHCDCTGQDQQPSTPFTVSQQNNHISDSIRWAIIVVQSKQENHSSVR